MMAAPGSAFSQVDGLELEEIEAGLRAWAAGYPATEAAVELLIGHRVWLGRADFRELLWSEDDVVGADPEELASLVFLAPASRSELAVLSLVVGLLGVEIIDPLSALLAGLGDRELVLVIEAVARCGGWQDRDQVHLATGRFDLDDEGAGR